jgi:hypothetical protein
MDFGNFSITKREIIFSVVILAVMLVFGFLIHGAIDDSLMLKHQEYNTALRIDGDADMFSYAMQTNIGNSYVHGTITTVDPVPCFEVGGEYSSVEKVKEKYTRHTRTVTETYVVNGKTQTRTRTEVYWTWDHVKTWRDSSSTIEFLEEQFPYGTISLPSESYIDTIKESSHIRYKYYGAPTTCDATIYADLRDNTISDVRTYHNTSIEDAHKIMTSKGELVIFWVLWIPLTGGAVFAFVYIDNHWLEDRRKSHYDRKMDYNRGLSRTVHAVQKPRKNSQYRRDNSW